jgi:hypothetical protein
VQPTLLRGCGRKSRVAKTDYLILLVSPETKTVIPPNQTRHLIHLIHRLYTLAHTPHNTIMATVVGPRDFCSHIPGDSGDSCECLPCDCTRWWTKEAWMGTLRFDGPDDSRAAFWYESGCFRITCSLCRREAIFSALM